MVPVSKNILNNYEVKEIQVDKEQNEELFYTHTIKFQFDLNKKEIKKEEDENDENNSSEEYELNEEDKEI